MAKTTRINFKRNMRPAGLRKAFCIEDPDGGLVHSSSVYDGIAAEMDTSGGRWQAVCELHGEICCTRTQIEALTLAIDTTQFCEECRERLEGGDE